MRHLIAALCLTPLPALSQDVIPSHFASGAGCYRGALTQYQPALSIEIFPVAEHYLGPVDLALALQATAGSEGVFTALAACTGGEFTTCKIAEGQGRFALYPMEVDTMELLVDESLILADAQTGRGLILPMETFATFVAATGCAGG